MQTDFNLKLKSGVMQMSGVSMSELVKMSFLLTDSVVTQA